MPRSSSSGLVRCAHRLKVTESMKTISGSKRLGADPGHEFSGVVAALGEDVTGIEGGQEV